MQRKIIPLAEAMTSIENLLKNSNRVETIKSFSYEEVTTYIQAVKVWLVQLDYSVKLGLANGLRAGPNYFQGPFDDSVRIPSDKAQRLVYLFFELEQQKAYLKKVTSLQQRLKLNTLTNQISKSSLISSSLTKPTSPKDGKEIQSDSDVAKALRKEMPDEEALHVIESYQKLDRKFKALNDKYNALQVSESKKTALLASQSDQLAHSKLEVTKMRSELSALRISNAAATATISMYQNELRLLKPQEPSIFEIKMTDYADLLAKYHYKTGSSLFSTKRPDPTLVKLKNILKLKADSVSIKSIENCIVDSVDKEIFNDPYHYHDSRQLNITGLILRELGFCFREGPELLESSKQHLA